MATRAATKKALLKKAMTLPADDRAALAHELLDSVHDAPEDPKEVEEAWRVEIERRIAEIDSGKAKLIPWEEAHARILASLKKVRARRTAFTGRSRS